MLTLQIMKSVLIVYKLKAETWGVRRARDERERVVYHRCRL